VYGDRGLEDALAFAALVPEAETVRIPTRDGIRIRRRRSSTWW
jgi:hypothetical protein